MDVLALGLLVPKLSVLVVVDLSSHNGASTLARSGKREPYHAVFFVFCFFLIYLFIFGCVWSLLLRAGLL